MNKKSKIYVAGHTGLVGSAFMRGLKNEGYDNIVFRDLPDLDLRKQRDVEDFFKSEKPEYVILAAAKVGGILANNTYKAEFIYDNIMIAANVINSSHKYGVKKLLNLGSSCIYPKAAPQPLREEYLLTGPLESTNEPYAIAKIAAIKLCRYYNEQYGTNFISVMPTNMYGPNDNYNLETSHVLPALIRKFHLAKLLSENKYEELKKDIKKYPLGYGIKEQVNGKNIEAIKEKMSEIGITSDYVKLWGSGEGYREFLYVDDLVDACIYLMQEYNYKNIGEIINIGTGKDIKIKGLAKLISKIINYKGQIKWDTNKPEGTARKLLDVEKINKLGWKSKVPLLKGLEYSFESYKGKQIIL